MLFNSCFVNCAIALLYDELDLLKHDQRKVPQSIKLEKFDPVPKYRLQSRLRLLRPFLITNNVQFLF